MSIIKQERTRGSIWRKWDLHVHVPGTRMNNQYKSLNDGTPDWERFVNDIHASDVAAIGITDYFSLKSFYVFKELYEQKYPDSGKVFFPNLELRLEHAVNEKNAEVNIHLILPPHLTKDDASTLLSNLVLNNLDTAGNGKRKLLCSQVQGWSQEQLASASTTVDSVIEAITKTFSVSEDNLEDAAIILVSGRDDGLSPGSHMSPVKEACIDRIDIKTHALFTRGKDANYWLKKNRIARGLGSTPKPTFGGCDAHSFEDLNKMLGNSGKDKHRTWELTWIKGDLSYAGLLQTLAEPDERVRIQDEQPDEKDSFHVIDRIEFEDSSQYPESVFFNPNLTAIIGSRSSGKSALLAHTAYAVDKAYTIGQQAKVNDRPASIKSQGPANPFSWEEVEDLERRVVWKDESVKEGKVIYMPQNALFELGDNSETVAELIEPLLKEKHPEAANVFVTLCNTIVKTKSQIRSHVDKIVSAQNELSGIRQQIKDLGDKSAIEKQIEGLATKRDEAIKDSGLTEDEQAKLQKVNDLITKETLSAKAASKQLDDWAKVSGVDKPFEVDVMLKPTLEQIPVGLRAKVQVALDELRQLVSERVKNVADSWQEEQVKEKSDSERLIASTKLENAVLLRKSNDAKSAAEISKKMSPLEDIMSSFKELEAEAGQAEQDLEDCYTGLQECISTFDTSVDQFIERFNNQSLSLADGEIKVERGYPSASESLIEKVNLRTAKRWLSDGRDEKQLDLNLIQKSAEEFIKEVLSGAIKLKKHEDTYEVITQIMTSIEEVRLYAIYDEDRIGGFEPTSMTPGKRALFALSLLLDGEQQKWPLLLDQPEDDLDSRSVFDTIVPFLKRVKKNRQVIMVTHDANLVVGSDAEEVIVANRHGSDRPNHDPDRLFDYMSGSLENTMVPNEDDIRVLERQGIREHCCEILDGGLEAFQKRKEKYKI